MRSVKRMNGAGLRGLSAIGVVGLLSGLLAVGCNDADKTAAGPVITGVDGTAVDGGVTTDVNGDAQLTDSASPDVQGGDTGPIISCTSDLECLADFKASPCAQPRCVNGACVIEVLAKGTPCNPDGLEPSQCQQTQCDGGGKCAFLPATNGKACGDSVCGDACVAGVCVTAAANDDGNPCTTTVCKNGAISHVPVNDPTVVCKDSQKCIDKGVCLAGVCAGGKQLCDDGVACTIDFCQPGKGCVFLSSDGLCDDGNPCTQSACDAKKGCVSGPGKAATPCDDGNPCTQKDACNGLGVCLAGTNTCKCQSDGDCLGDSDPAGGGDKCKPLACIDGACKLNPKAQVTCSDLDAFCLASVCQPSTGKCATVPVHNGDACDDNDACSLKSACSSGTCKSTLAADCDDGNACTKDACDPKAGKCANVAIPGCGGGCTTDQSCDDNNACTDDQCTTSGKCLHALTPSCTPCKTAAQCNDGDPCTLDGCGDAGVCLHKPDTSVPNCGGGGCVNNQGCDDKDACTQDSCGSDGNCYYKQLPDCPKPQCKVDTDCPQPGSPCASAVCTDAGQCVIKQDPNCGGGCKSDAACDDKNPCTKDACDATGTCQHAVIAGCQGCVSQTQCVDSNPCTLDSCTDGQCKNVADPGCKQCKNDKHCDDGKPCTKDVCGAMAASGIGKCTWTPIAGGSCPQCYQASDCTDNNLCTVDKCGTSGVFKDKCQYTKKSCFDGNDCTYDTCDAKSGACSFAKIPNCGGGCSNSQQCTDNSPCITSYCSAGVCKAQAKTCNDNDSCTFDACSPTNGACVYSPIAGCNVGTCATTPDCDDGDPCTYDQCSAFSGKCYNSVIPNCDPTAPKCKSAADCDDNKPCTNDYCSTFSGQCTHNTAPNCVIGKACKSSADCDDKNLCTSNPCVSNKCGSSPISCNDYNPCTNDFCQSFSGNCTHSTLSGCVAEKCTTVKECDDQNKCTLDSCLFGFCQHNQMPGCS